MKKLTVTNGQMLYEFDHLQKKLMKRDIAQYAANLYTVYDINMKIKTIKPNNFFRVIKGDIEKWEKVK
jgi:hypothetical protein